MTVIHTMETNDEIPLYLTSVRQCFACTFGSAILYYSRILLDQIIHVNHHSLGLCIRSEKFFWYCRNLTKKRIWIKFRAPTLLDWVPLASQRRYWKHSLNVVIRHYKSITIPFNLVWWVEVFERRRFTLMVRIGETKLRI